MIDLSCHLLEGFGCGPNSLEESVEMCRLAEEAGVGTVVATPCWTAGTATPPLTLAECDRRLEVLKRHVGRRVLLEFGFSFHYSTDLPLIADTFGPKIALGQGRHLLVAPPVTEVPSDVERILEELRRRGYSVVLARPECSPALRAQRARLDEWVRWGVKIQLAAASVTGAHGRTVKQFSMSCLGAYGESVALATRARSARRADFILGLARDEVAKKFGDSKADASVTGLPLKIISVPSSRWAEKETRPAVSGPPSTIGAIKSALSLLKSSA